MNNYPRDNETSPIPGELLNPFWIGYAFYGFRRPELGSRCSNDT